LPLQHQVKNAIARKRYVIGK